MTSRSSTPPSHTYQGATLYLQPEGLFDSTGKMVMSRDVILGELQAPVSEIAPFDHNAIIEECARVCDKWAKSYQFPRSDKEWPYPLVGAPFNAPGVAEDCAGLICALKRTAPQGIGKEASQAQGNSLASQPSVDGPDSQLRPAVAARSEETAERGCAGRYVAIGQWNCPCGAPRMRDCPNNFITPPPNAPSDKPGRLQRYTFENLGAGWQFTTTTDGLWVMAKDADDLERELAECKADLARAIANHAADLSAQSAIAPYTASDLALLGAADTVAEDSKDRSDNEGFLARAYRTVRRVDSRSA